MTSTRISSVNRNKKEWASGHGRVRATVTGHHRHCWKVRPRAPIQNSSRRMKVAIAFFSIFSSTEGRRIRRNTKAPKPPFVSPFINCESQVLILQQLDVEPHTHTHTPIYDHTSGWSAAMSGRGISIARNKCNPPVSLRIIDHNSSTISNATRLFNLNTVPLRYLRLLDASQ